MSLPTKKTAILQSTWQAAALVLGLVHASDSFAVKVLVFSKVAEGAYRHASIPNGVAAIHEIGAAKGWQVDDTIDAKAFNGQNLELYDVVVWNNTGGTVLNDLEKASFEAFIHRGGGYVGVHMAAAGATEPNWTWYSGLLGATFKTHPDGTPTANLVGALSLDPATKLPTPWRHTDEWYEWVEDPLAKPAMYPLLVVDEKSYGGGTGYHAVAWCHEYEGGRAFYTALGHTDESFTEGNFRKHLAGGIEWASAHSPNLAKSAQIETKGLLLDLNADQGVMLEEGNKVSAWKNQVSDFVAQNFIKRDAGRATLGSGRPTLRQSVAALNGHNSLVFHESELVNREEDAFDRLITGSGYTWIVLLAPYAQIGRAPNVNAFLGDLKNGGLYEGFWAGLEDDNAVWMGSRNGVTFDDANNPKVTGPRLQKGQYYIVAGRMGAGPGAVTSEIFVDSATPVGSHVFPVNPNAKSSKLAIGQERDATNHPGLESFDGEIARILIYGRPLLDTELSDTINALKQDYFGSTPP